MQADLAILCITAPVLYSEAFGVCSAGLVRASCAAAGPQHAALTAATWTKWALHALLSVLEVQNSSCPPMLSDGSVVLSQHIPPLTFSFPHSGIHLVMFTAAVGILWHTGEGGQEYNMAFCLKMTWWTMVTGVWGHLSGAVLTSRRPWGQSQLCKSKTSEIKFAYFTITLQIVSDFKSSSHHWNSSTYYKCFACRVCI